MQYVVLVTGGHGFLGQHVVKHLHLYGANIKEIRVLDIVKYEQKLGMVIVEFLYTRPFYYLANKSFTDFKHWLINNSVSVVFITNNSSNC